MSALLVLVMCLAVQATGCPERCLCRDLLLCRGPLSPSGLPQLLTALGQLTQLQHLALQQCDIPDMHNLTYQGIEHLRTLDLSRNLITELSGEMPFNQTELRALDVSQNLIRVIHGSPFRTMCSLEVLNLSANAIDTIAVDSFCGLHSLLTLDLSGNNLTVLQDEMFSTLVSLQQLNLSKNQLKSLSESCFTSLQRLQQLDLSWNQLRHMAPGTLQALPSLSRLLLAGNWALGGGDRDAALLVGTGRRLQTLDASRTGLEHVPATLTHSVRTLRLSGNSIRTVQCGDLDSYPLLQLLDLTTNLLEEMEEDALGRLELLVILYLTNNKLHAIPRSLPDQLKILHLEFNRIEQIVSGDLLSLPKLEVLLLNDNNIKVVQEGAFSQMTSLITLDLSRNPISILPAGTLSGPARLQVLRLSSLSVEPPAEDTTFPVQAPEHLVRLDLSGSPGLARQMLADKAALVAFRELQELNLTNADLINIRSDLLHFLPQLRDLHIAGNRLNCSGLLWLALWMRVQDQPENRQVSCFAPPELYGTLVVDLQDTDMETTTENIITVSITKTEVSTVTPASTLPTVADIHVELENIFSNNVENKTLKNVAGIQNVDKELINELNESIPSTSGEIIKSTSPVTSTPDNRSNMIDNSTEQVHQFPMVIESTTSVSTHVTKVSQTDGHIVDIIPSNNPLSTQPSNYKDDKMRTDSTSASRRPTPSDVSRVTEPVTAALLERHRFIASPSPRHANRPAKLSVNKARWSATETSTTASSKPVPQNTTEGEVVNATSGEATGEMSRYSSGKSERAAAPGLLVLLGAAAGAGLALCTLVSHVRKRRRRAAAAAAAGARYSRHQDIEVNSLPGLSDLW